MNEPIKTLAWLLEEENPSVRYRTLVELLDFDDPLEIIQLKSAILASPAVQTLLGKMQPGGYWLQTNPRTLRVVGETVEYGSFGTTHFCLAYLAEMGMDRAQPDVAKAAERYLALQGADGDWVDAHWYGHLSCLLAYNLRTFILLGYRKDARVQRAADFLLQTDRPDGGYLCGVHEGKYKNRPVKSCIRGSVKALLAFAEMPETWDHPRCRQLVDYFLTRGGIFQSTHPDIPVNQDMQRLSFPITWRANTWEVLYALSKMGLGGDERLQAAWLELDKRADPAGRYSLDWTPTQAPWKVGRPGEPNKWITFYAAAARKYQRLPVQA